LATIQLIPPQGLALRQQDHSDILWHSLGLWPQLDNAPHSVNITSINLPENNYTEWVDRATFYELFAMSHRCFTCRVHSALEGRMQMLHARTTPQAKDHEVVFSCPDKNVPVKIGLRPMTPRQFVQWRAINIGVATFVKCTACTNRHLVLAGDCFLQGEEL
jgi:hypothetical protein